MSDQSRGKVGAYEVSGAILAVLGGLLLAGFIAIILSLYEQTNAIRESQKQNSPVLEATSQAAESAEEAAEAIEDCTTPKGECYQQGQKRTAAAVADISVLSVYAAACATTESRSPDFETIDTRVLAERIQQCVTRLAGSPPAR